LRLESVEREGRWGCRYACALSGELWIGPCANEKDKIGGER
jgi:hypothetical protein